MEKADPKELSERFRWVIKSRSLNQSKWSKAAGMSQSVVGQIVRDERKGKIPHTTFMALASAANVDATWLATGEGSPDGEEFDPYPTRAGVIAMLRSEGADESVIDSLRRIRFKEGDPGVARWIELAEQLIEGKRIIAQALKLGPEDDRFN